MESLARHCKSIQRLTLAGIHLTGAGLLTVLRGTGSSLKYLELCDCPKVNRDENAMMSIPRFCSSLEELVLDETLESGKLNKRCLEYLQSRISLVRVLDGDDY